MILVTGANGFVGRRLCATLGKHESIRISVRQRPVGVFFDDFEFVQGSLAPDQDWTIATAGVSVVVHCAARVHIMKENAVNPLAEFRRVNVDGTLHLARQAAKAGVRRFVFISSIKVNGEHSQLGLAFTADQAPTPADPYGISKYEAENALRALSEETGMEVVVIRPPLVYGPGVQANFLAMMRWLWRGIPLPLGGVTANRRSLVYLDNLVDLIATCIKHPSASNQTFLVSDDEDLSSAALLDRMARALGRPARLIQVPSSVIEVGAKMIGSPGVAQRLCGSLQADISKTKQLLSWVPPYSVDEGLQWTADHWLKAKNRS